MFWRASKRPAICCTECGEKLASLDFLAGRALYLASGPYCRACSPLPMRTSPRAPEPPPPVVRQRL